VTKIQLIDFIRLRTGEKYVRNDIIHAIDKMYNQILCDIASGDEFDFVTKAYYDVDVTLDATTERYSSDLPAPILQVQGLTDGVRNINTVKGTEFSFFPITEDEWELYRGTLADTINTKIGYMVKRNEVWYYNFNTTISKVRMELVVPFSEFSNTDEVPLPAGKDQTLVQGVIDLLTQTVPKELKVDENG